MLREDDCEVNFVYGPEATNADISKRHMEPLVRKAVEGYNVTVLVCGSSGAQGWLPQGLVCEPCAAAGIRSLGAGT